MTLDFILHQRSGERLELLPTLKGWDQVSYEVLENGHGAPQDSRFGNIGHDEIGEYLVERLAGRTLRSLEFRRFRPVCTSG
ncbi:hypothetical protein [Mesorhizobium sp. M0800]|uniref:hypothetical protein n=1 Tax=Mesorhizobium sp. M0800 TaxID=2957000 RepID=UPI00333AA737